MKIQCTATVVFLIFLILLGCGGKTEPKEYIHEQANFKITLERHWRQVAADSEMYELRCGDSKLVEVGSFTLPITQEEMQKVTDDELNSLISESSLGALDAYCKEATIDDYELTDQQEVAWCDLPAYRIQARGFSRSAGTSVVVDMINGVQRDECRMYMFVSQLDKDSYERMKTELDGIIASFQILR